MLLRHRHADRDRADRRRPTREPEIREFIGADSLGYLSIRGVLAALELPYERFCFACFDGHYPEPVPYDAASRKFMLEEAVVRRGWRDDRDERATGGRDALPRVPGVDVAAGERAVDLMRAHVESTRRPEVVGGLGGFGGAIAIPAGYREPLLVASTDGVGTKTAIAAALGRFDTIGIDLVAMCADDVVCCGAEPLAFLDYVAVGQVVPEWVAELVGSVAAGCRDAGCALVGGETAEHPGLMDRRRVRPVGLLHRRRRAGRRDRRERGRGPATSILGLAVVRAACQRLLAGPRAASPSGTST